MLRNKAIFTTVVPADSGRVLPRSWVLSSSVAPFCINMTAWPWGQVARLPEPEDGGLWCDRCRLPRYRGGRLLLCVLGIVADESGFEYKYRRGTALGSQNPLSYHSPAVPPTSHMFWALKYCKSPILHFFLLKSGAKWKLQKKNGIDRNTSVTTVWN